MTQPTVCPTCGVPNAPHEDFCVDCGSLLLSVGERAADPPPEAAASDAVSGLVAPRPRSVVKSPAENTPPIEELAAVVLECWDCGAPNTRERRFCASCGVWLHTSTPPPVQASAPTPTGAGPAPGPATIAFGSVAALDRASRKSRNLMALVTAVIAIGVLGLAGALLGSPLLDGNGDGSDEAAVAALVADDASPAAQADDRAPASDEPVADPNADPVAEVATPAPQPAITPVPAAQVRDEPEAADPQVSAAAAPDEASVGEPKIAVEPEMAVEPEIAAEPEVAQTASGDIPPAAIKRAQPNTWVCNGDVRVEDPRGRRWSVNKVTFLPRDGYERVVLHLERTGPSGGALAAVTAQAFDTSTIRRYVAGAAKPGGGRTTVGVHLVDGIASSIGLRRYRPRGMQTVKEFSVYPAARSSSKVLITSAGDGCFRLRVPAWESDDGAPLQKAQILLDVRR